MCKKNEMNSGCVEGHKCAYNPRDPSVANICVPEEKCGQTVDMDNVLTKVECNAIKMITGIAATILAVSYTV